MADTSFIDLPLLLVLTGLLAREMALATVLVLGPVPAPSPTLPLPTTVTVRRPGAAASVAGSTSA